MALAIHGYDTLLTVEKLVDLAREKTTNDAEETSLCVLAFHALQGVSCF